MIDPFQQFRVAHIFSLAHFWKASGEVGQFKKCFRNITVSVIFFAKRFLQNESEMRQAKKSN